MKKLFNILILLSLGLLFNCSEDKIDVLKYGTITGRVVEANSFEPIENSKVSISPTNNTVFSDAEGYFVLLDVEEGDYSVNATKEDYLTAFEPITVTADVEVNVIFEMEDDNYLNRPPLTPILKTPIDGVKNQETMVALTWSSSDPDNDPILYKLELKNDYDNSVIAIEDIVDTTYVVSDLKYGVKYFWQIAANDDINPEVLSVIGAFETKVNPENRHLYVRKHSNNNNVIYSSNFIVNDDEDMNEVQLTSEIKNSWRPRKNQTSNLVAFLQTTNNETHLFTMEANGSNIRQVTSEVAVNGYDLNEIDFSWSSNGGRLIYSHYDKLYVINKDGSGLSKIYETPDGSFITECDWSNDESIIALKTNDYRGYEVKIFTIDMSGNLLKTILSNVKGAAGGLNISIDNKNLLFTRDVSGYENSNKRQLDTRIFVYQFSAGITTDISEQKENGTNDLDPRFSPNESEIIFVNTSNDGISSSHIYKMSVENRNDERMLLFSNAIMPDWE